MCGVCVIVDIINGRNVFNLYSNAINSDEVVLQFYFSKIKASCTNDNSVKKIKLHSIIIVEFLLSFKTLREAGENHWLG